MANYIPLRVNNTDGVLERLDAGDGLFFDFLERLASSGDITIGSALTAVQATGTITVAGIASAGATITIGGVVLTAVAGARTPGSDDFSVGSGTTTGIAAEINAAINDGANSFTTIVTSSVLSSVVTLTAVPLGDAGNSITLSTSDAVNFTLSGANLTGGDTPEVILGSSQARAHVLGDLLVDGSSAITVDETVTGSFTVEGNVNLGNNTGDIINLGGGTSDTVNLKGDLAVGAGLVAVGSSTTDYVLDLWLDAINANGPALAAYNLNETGTNAGAYAIGIDPALLNNATATDLMTALDQMDAAISSGGSGTNSTTFTINADAVAGTPEDACLLLQGGDGVSLIESRLCQDSSALTMFMRIYDDSVKVDPTFAIGDVISADVGGLTPTLQLVATNSTPANVVGEISFQVTGANAYGDIIFGGSGITTNSIVGPSLDNQVDLGATAANRFADAYFGNNVTTGTSFVVGNTTLDTNSLDNSAGALSIDLVAASADGVLTITNTGATPTGADIDFAVAGSAIRRSGDALSEILVSNLVSKAAAETISGGWTFNTANVSFSGIATGYVESAGDPTAAANTGFLYTKDDGGDTELYYRDDSGNIVQITLDGALNATSTLQEAYVAGNTIAVTTGEGSITFSNDTTADTTTVLSVSRAPAVSTAGIGIDLSMGANTTGVGLNIATAGSGDAVLINNTGTGDALDVQDGGGSVLQVTGAGAVNITPTSGQTVTITAAGAGTVDINSADAITVDAGAGISIDAAGASNFSTSAGNITIDAAAGELTFDDVGNSGIELSQSADRVLDQTAAGEVFASATSIIGALNALAREIQENGQITAQWPIENGVTVAAGDVISASTTSGRVTQGSAGSAGNKSIIGIALTGGTGDAGGTVLSRFVTPGSIVAISGASFTPGTPVFAPTSPGPPVDTFGGGAGDRNIRLGYAITATTIMFSPSSGFTL